MDGGVLTKVEDHGQVATVVLVSEKERNGLRYWHLNILVDSNTGNLNELANALLPQKPGQPFSFRLSCRHALGRNAAILWDKSPSTPRTV